MVMKIVNQKTTSPPNMISVDEENGCNESTHSESHGFSGIFPSTSGASHQAFQGGSSSSLSNTAPHMLVYRRRAVLLSLLIVMVGIVAGSAFLVTGIRNAKNDQENRFEQQATEIVTAVETSWQEFSITTLWLHKACHGFPENPVGTPSKSLGCTHRQFEDYFDYISSSGLDFDNVIWMSNVSHAERGAVEEESRTYFDVHYPNFDYKGIVEAVFNVETGQFEAQQREEQPWYFTQHFMSPLDDISITFIDNDFQTSALFPSMLSAIENMRPTVSQRLPKKNELNYFVRMNHPGIHKNDDPQYNGVAVAQVGIFDLLVRALRSNLDQVSVFLYDITTVPWVDLTPNTTSASDLTDDKLDALFLGGAKIVDKEGVDDANNKSLPTMVEIIGETERNEAIKEAKKHLESVIYVEDRTWLVVVTDPIGTYNTTLLIPIVGGCLIMLSAILIAVWFITSTARAARIQSIEAAREAEKATFLERMNRALNYEVELRVNELRRTESVANQKSREAEQAEARSESMMQTMSMLSHELRTPLQGIMGVTSMMLSDFLLKEDVLNNVKDGYSTSKDSDCGERLHKDGGFASSRSDSTVDDTILTGDSCNRSISTLSSVQSDKILENINTIQASSQLLLTLINNLLDVRKINTGMMEGFELECVDLGHVVYQSTKTLKPLADLSNIKFNLGPGILTDGFKGVSNTTFLAKGAILPIQQVLINLVGNAIKYGSVSLTAVEGPTFIDISIRRSTKVDAQKEASEALCSSISFNNIPSSMSSGSDVFIVDIRDRGNGIPEDEAEKVFGAFQMLKKHSGKSKGFAQPTGSGLGLQLCLNMVYMMNGCIWANNCEAPGALGALRAAGAADMDFDGSVFSFFLECPTTEEADVYFRTTEDEGAFVTDFSSSKATGVRINNDCISKHPTYTRNYRVIPEKLSEAKVFVVDDTLINLKVLRRMLGVLGYKNIRWATSGAKAFEMLKEDPDCDLILTDYQMPGMDGLEFSEKARQLYADLGAASAVIALCSADYSTSLSSKCEHVGIEYILRKPITLTELSEFVRKLSLHGCVQI